MSFRERFSVLADVEYTFTTAIDPSHFLQFNVALLMAFMVVNIGTEQGNGAEIVIAIRKTRSQFPSDLSIISSSGDYDIAPSRDESFTLVSYNCLTKKTTANTRGSLG